MMHPNVAKALEEIDAACFSGDTFFGPEELAELKKYVGRWKRFIQDQDDTILLPHKMLFDRTSDAALRYVAQTGPQEEAETVVTITVLHTQEEAMVTRVEANTTLNQPYMYRIGGQR